MGVEVGPPTRRFLWRSRVLSLGIVRDVEYDERCEAGDDAGSARLRLLLSGLLCSVEGRLPMPWRSALNLRLTLEFILGRGAWGFLFPACGMLQPRCDRLKPRCVPGGCSRKVMGGWCCGNHSDHSDKPHYLVRRLPLLCEKDRFIRTLGRYSSSAPQDTTKAPNPTTSLQV